MPYIIETTTRRGHDGQARGIAATRTAVATLDEAREAVQHALSPFDADATPAPDDDLNDYSRAYFSACADKECMDESGGTVGPLPDGTVIEVRPVDWSELAAAVPLEIVGDALPAYGGAAILAAFNAA